MKVVRHEKMVVECRECNATCETDDLDDFRETHTYPPIFYFMCPACNNLAKPKQTPKRLLATSINKISRERGYSDETTFSRLNKI